ACFTNAHMRARGLRIARFQVRVRFPFFADLVVFAGGLNPIPSRTRPLNSPAPMVLSLKAWKSRSLPGLPKTEMSSSDVLIRKALAETRGLFAFSVPDQTNMPFQTSCAPDR